MSDRWLALFGRWLGPLLAGYLLFDRAFAYVHVPGLPLFIGEIVLGIGLLGVLAATGHARIPLREEPILTILLAFMAWGALRTVPGLPVYGVDAVRDAVLWYYAVFAVLTVAAISRSPDLVDRLLHGLHRLTPWLLSWLPVAVLLAPLAAQLPAMPDSNVSVAAHKPGNTAIAALIGLAAMWLFPRARAAQRTTGWSILALVVIVLAATQNRGGLLGVSAGAAVGLAFVPHRGRLILRTVAVLAAGLALSTLFALKIPVAGLQGREFSASQLIANVVSLGGHDSPGNLGGTVDGREQLWSRILAKQVDDGHLLDGSGFGPNLAADVGVYDSGTDSLRSPHNSHLHVFARLGVVGTALWVALWAAWYHRLIRGSRWLAQAGEPRRRGVAVFAMTVTTAILVSSVFDPQLEGPQIAILLWTLFGIGVAATSSRPWAAGCASSRPAVRGDVAVHAPRPAVGGEQAGRH